MRILSVVWGSPSTNPAQWKRIQKLNSLMRDYSHQVDLVQVGPDAPRIDKNESYNYETKPLSLVQSLYYIRKRIADNKYDIIFGNLHLGALMTTFAGEKVPVIFDMHGDIVSESRLRTNLFSWNFLKSVAIDKLTKMNASAVLCVSQDAMIDTRRSIFLRKTPVYRVPNGVDLGRYSPSTQPDEKLRQQIETLSRPIFGYIGGFQEFQGTTELINAATSVSPDIASFLFVGRDGQATSKNVVFHGRVSEERVAGCYAMCDILVLPRPSVRATEVAAPTKFAEYTAMGKPILTTNVGEAGQLVKEYECGVVVKNNQPENLRRGIKRMTDADDKELTRWGRNARKLAKNEFNWKTIGEDLNSILYEAKESAK